MPRSEKGMAFVAMISFFSILGAVFGFGFADSDEWIPLAKGVARGLSAGAVTGLVLGLIISQEE